MVDMRWSSPGKLAGGKFAVLELVAAYEGLIISKLRSPF